MPEKMAEQNQAEIPFSTAPVVHIAGTRVGIRVLNSDNSLAAVPLAPRVLRIEHSPFKSLQCLNLGGVSRLSSTSSNKQVQNL